jgi:hypothetical protein
MTKKKRWFIAFVIGIAYSLVLVLVLPNIITTLSKVSTEYDELIKPLQPLTVLEPIAFNPAGRQGYIVPYTDIEIALSVTYPNGILVTNENVSVVATVFWNITNNDAENMTSFYLTFQNAVDYPLTFQNLTYQDKNFQTYFPMSGYFSFDNVMSMTNKTGRYYLTGTALMQANRTIMWQQEGDYKPILQINYVGGSSLVNVIDEVVFHVNPREQLTQLETNRIGLEANIASLRLSEAVLILGTIAIVALCVQIVDRSDYECNYPKNNGTKHEDCPYLIAKRTHEIFIVKRKKEGKYQKEETKQPEK